MCGLNVLINGTQEQMDRMNNEIEHRGLRTLHFHDGPLRMSQRRLPIIGLGEESDPPYVYNQYVMMGVGEFFNYQDYDGEAVNDFEVVIKQYAIHGPMALKQFDGFWSIAVYDRFQQTLNIHLDYMAQKPLYMRQKERQVAISSEMWPLLALGDVEPDELYFSEVAKFGYTDRTPFLGISKLARGSWNIIDLSRPIKKLEFQIYDLLNPKKDYGNWPIKRDIIESVRRRLISDMPVSIVCSGGLDSTIIWSIANKFHDNIQVFHAPNGSDTPYMKYITDDYIELPIDYDDKTEDILIANGTPVDLGSMIPQYRLAQAIKKLGFYVTLSGDGADELFGGYRRAQTYDSQMSDVFNELVLYHLPRLDRLMMWHTIELRCPFLGRDVMEHALGLPWKGQRQRKERLKELFKDDIPKEILERDKEPLKIKEVREDKMTWRLKLIKMFMEEVFDEEKVIQIS